MDSSWLTVGNGDPTPRLIESWECVEEVSFKGVILLSSEVLAGLPAPARTLRSHVASLLNYELDETRFFVQATIRSKKLLFGSEGGDGCVRRCVGRGEGGGGGGDKPKRRCEGGEGSIRG